MRRARTPHAKEQRRESILAAATALLDRHDYDGVTMAQVARDAGIAKGTTYLYFRTKEQLFLALLEEEYAAWFGAARSALRALTPRPPASVVADALVSTVRDRPRFLGLMELLHVVIEPNVSVEAAGTFRTRLRDEVTGLALVLSEVTGMSMGRAGKLLMHLHALVIGLRQLARPAGNVAEALTREDLAVMRVDFEAELSAALSAMLRDAAGEVR